MSDEKEKELKVPAAGGQNGSTEDGQPDTPASSNEDQAAAAAAPAPRIDEAAPEAASTAGAAGEAPAVEAGPEKPAGDAPPEAGADPEREAKLKAAAEARAARAAAKAAAAGEAPAEAAGPEKPAGDAPPEAGADPEREAKLKAAAEARAARAAAKAAAAGDAPAGDAPAGDADAEREAKLKAAAEAREARAAAKAKAESDAAAAEPKEPSPRQPLLDEAVRLIRSTVAEDAVEEAAINEMNDHMPTIVVKGDRLLQVAKLFKDDKSLDCSYLRNVSGIDYESHLEVVYHLVSLQTKREYALKVRADRQSPSVPSVVPLWATANWNEREIFDLLGIVFTGHPDLRRIMMPDDWVGHPLRKDYEPLDPEV
ncbi:NADH-quinone oxidoreductase subunit C [Paenibacillus nasutitermitis]|uniref:NADH-quinone oxidoreductase subunit C n=1 Tax=Paenibacillus nasutitermitis TaxID=1652958 RepID=A0A916ZFG1_9BACL|nr:NADH-quinone oxidoreductase subunit C [Paenibacillus nasutitermitis]GGD92639.1 hypothetical protein GCM10010911_59060 [Paenibacillus nasutitermitis]